MVNVVGTSTCIIGITPSVNLVPGVCGVVQGSVHPLRTGIEAGMVVEYITDESGNVEYGHVSWREYRMPDAVRH